MDLDSGEDGPGRATVLLRAALFFGWFLAFLASMAVIGLIPTVPLIVIAFMRVEGREPWRLCLGYAAGVTAMIYIIFDRIIHIPWPDTLVGTLVPVLHQLVPSM